LSIWSLLVEAGVELTTEVVQVQVVSAQALDLLSPLEQITQSQLGLVALLAPVYKDQIPFLALLLQQVVVLGQIMSALERNLEVMGVLEVELEAQQRERVIPHP
jgi:hypothetical protein